jgi:hypothetical protein
VEKVKRSEMTGSKKRKQSPPSGGGTGCGLVATLGRPDLPERTVRGCRRTVTKLVKKRQTYERYFAEGLTAIDHALLRVKTYRCVVSGIQVAEYHDDVLLWRKLAKPRLGPDATQAVRELANQSLGKSKKKAKKYAKSLISRAERSAFKRTGRLLSFEEKLEKERKRQADSLFRRQMAERTELYAVLGPAAFEERLREEEYLRQNLNRPFFYDRDGKRRFLTRSHVRELDATRGVDHPSLRRTLNDKKT